MSVKMGEDWVTGKAEEYMLSVFKGHFKEKKGTVRAIVQGGYLTRRVNHRFDGESHERARADRRGYRKSQSHERH
jgi:hypothetical protein